MMFNQIDRKNLGNVMGGAARVAGSSGSGMDQQLQMMLQQITQSIANMKNNSGSDMMMPMMMMMMMGGGGGGGGGGAVAAPPPPPPPPAQPSGTFVNVKVRGGF